MLHSGTNVSFDELPWSHPWLYNHLFPLQHYPVQPTVGLLQPLEFPNRPIKDIVVLEALLVEKVVEHLPGGSIVRSIFVAQVVHIIHVVGELGWKIGAKFTYASRLPHLQNTQIFGLAGGSFETLPGGAFHREVFE